MWESERDWGEAPSSSSGGNGSGSSKGGGWGHGDPPSMGESKDGYETADAFYSSWAGFVSGLSFGWVDEYNVNEVCQQARACVCCVLCVRSWLGGLAAAEREEGREEERRGEALCYHAHPPVVQLDVGLEHTLSTQCIGPTPFPTFSPPPPFLPSPPLPSPLLSPPQADNRRVRRLMEKENAKRRAVARRKYQDDVRALADFCKRRDKRVIRHKLELAKEKEER